MGYSSQDKIFELIEKLETRYLERLELIDKQLNAETKWNFLKSETSLLTTEEKAELDVCFDNCTKSQIATRLAFVYALGRVFYDVGNYFDELAREGRERAGQGDKLRQDEVETVNSIDLDCI